MAYKVRPNSLRTAGAAPARQAAPGPRAKTPQPARSAANLSPASTQNEQPSAAGKAVAGGLGAAYQPVERSASVVPGFSETREKPGLGTRVARTVGLASDGDRIRQDLNNTQIGPRDGNHSVSGTSTGTPYDDHIVQNFGGDGVGPLKGDRPNTALSAYGRIRAGDGDDVVTVNGGPNVTRQDINRTSDIDLGQGQDHLAIGTTGGLPGTVFYNGRPLFDLKGANGVTGTHNYNVTDNPSDGFSMSFPQASAGAVHPDHPLFTSGRLQLPDRSHGGNVAPGFLTVPAQ